jgi:hypothetical protein
MLGPVLPVSSYDFEISEDGWVVLTFLGADESGWPPRRTQEERGWPALKTAVLGSLAVKFSRVDPSDPASSADQPEHVCLRLAEGLTPTTLQRFAWARWLAVADAIARTGTPDKTIALQLIRRDPKTAAVVNRAVLEERGISASARRPEQRGLPSRSRSRPGRRGWEHEFYKRKAKRYMELRSEGERAPTKRIADEEFVSRHTAAGWVRRARELGYLQPGRRGRPG